MSGEVPSSTFHFRRTRGDQIAEGPDKIAEELGNEENVVGRARHEPLAEPLISHSVTGIQYDRTDDADRLAEEKAAQIPASAWDRYKNERKP